MKPNKEQTGVLDVKGFNLNSKVQIENIGGCELTDYITKIAMSQVGVWQAITPGI